MVKNYTKKNKNSKGSTKSAAKGGTSGVKNATGRREASSYVSSRIDSSIKLTDYLAYMPGILMVGMIALTLILDIASPKMATTQYIDFKNIFRVFDYVIIIGGVTFLAITAAKKKLKFCVRDYFFGAFMVCIIISTCINGLNHDAAFGISVRYIGIFNMFAFIIIYMKVSGYIERVSFRYTVLTGFLIVADAVALSALYNKYLGVIPAYQLKSGVTALFVNSNHYGYFLAMAIMIGIGYYIYEGWKRAILGTFSTVLNLFVLVLNNTFGAILAVGFCTIITVILVMVDQMKSARGASANSEEKSISETAKRALVLPIFGIIAFFVAINISDGIRNGIILLFRDMGNIIAGTSTGTEGSGRWSLWNTVVQYIVEKPLFGHGCEGITMRLKEATGMGDAHCEPLTYAAYYGIPGAILYLAGVTAAAVRYFKERQNLPPYCRIAFLGSAAYFISSLVGVPIFNTLPFFFIFMGMAAEEWKEWH